jgi:hypothetical protein
MSQGMDVHHCGLSASGEYVHTLQMVDIATGWVELVAVLGRSYLVMQDAFLFILQRIPFPILEIHPDNDTAFFNASRRLKSASLKKGRPSPSTGVASLRPYIEPGVEGAEPPPRGFGGCAPKNFKRRGELPTLPTPPRVGPNTLANPELTRVGKPGAKPPGRGSGGCAPTSLPFSEL